MRNSSMHRPPLLQQRLCIIITARPCAQENTWKPIEIFAQRETVLVCVDLLTSAHE